MIERAQCAAHWKIRGARLGNYIENYSAQWKGAQDHINSRF